MGTALARRRFLRRNQTNLTRPLIYCCELSGITDDAIPMNVALARRLAEVSPSARSMRLESCFVSALSDLPEDVVIRDIDVLFNPAYEVDVLALLCSAYRKHHFDLIWPGRFEDYQLVYAAEGCADYRAFDIDRYDLTCIY